MMSFHQRLLFTAAPFADESFVGYLLRICELNELESLDWLIELADLKKIRRENFNLFFDARQNLKQLAKITGVPINKLQSLLYQFEDNDNINQSLIECKVNFYGNFVSRYFIRREKPRLCPACLKEANYLRRIWEVAPATACPVHKCQLLDVCPSCGESLSWKRPKISICPCGCDWRKTKLIQIPTVGLRVSRQIYRLCGLLTDVDKSPDKCFLPPNLCSLNLADFLKILFFIRSFYHGLFDTEGCWLSSNYDSLKLHHELNEAVTVFNDFPRNFYQFLDWLKGQSAAIKCLPDLSKVKNFDYGYSYDKRLTEFNLLLDYLPGQKFDFLKLAFAELVIENKICILKS